MKFHLLFVFIFCIWLGKMCSGKDEVIDNYKKWIRKRIYAVGEQFVDDLAIISVKTLNNSLIDEIRYVTFSLLTELIPKEKNATIDVNQMKDYLSKQDRSSIDDKVIFDYLRISQAILSKQFPPERYNGIVNLIFVCVFECATTEEIQSALDYLYGIDVEATTTSFIDSHNLTKLTSENNCQRSERMSATIDELRSLVDIKPKVVEDFLAIREQFPCNRFVVQSVYNFVYIIKRLNGDKWKIDACMMKEIPWYWGARRDLETTESILSTRLSDETTRGLINFKRATIPDTPIEEIEKALVKANTKAHGMEYLYDDVPKTECPATENSTLKAN